MADLFLSYARPDRARVAEIVAAAQKGGRKLWWDGRLFPGDDYAMIIEREIDAARCVLVSWSATARDSLWVRAEANAALDQGKLVQVSFDNARLPLPFTMLHVTSLDGWRGDAKEEPWPDVDRRIGERIEGPVATVDASRRPDPGGVPLTPDEEKPLQGLGSAAAIGWTALGATLLLALCVIGAGYGLVGAGLFTILSFAALAVSIIVLVWAAWLLMRVEMASRR